MMLLAVAFGMSFVIGVAGVEMSQQPAVELPYIAKLILRCLREFRCSLRVRDLVQ